MGNALRDLTFEQWMTFVFDHPVDESRLEWYWDVDADWWDGPPAKTLQYLRRAFENAETLFQPYSDAQLNQGLWYLVSNACSEHMLALGEANVPWELKQGCIQSIHVLFEQCFARRCTPHLSHLDEPGAGPLNMVCYMWWDLFPFAGQPDEPARQEMDREILRVMESTLQLDSIACRESALHGLGHWQMYYPKPVTNMIERFLVEQKDMPEGLRSYARNASRGCVL